MIKSKIGRFIQKHIYFNFENDGSQNNKIIIFGSCRLGNISPKSYIHKVHHTHNTKEVIQYLQYIHGKIDIPPNLMKFVFRSCFFNPYFRINKSKLNSELTQANTICIEICSRKKYIKQSCYIHHLAADKGDAPGKNIIENDISTKDFTLTIQDHIEIEQDVLDICKLLEGKNIIFVTHIDCGIDKRNDLIFIIESICKKHNLVCINPIRDITNLSSELIDSNHYTKSGLKLVSKYINSVVQKNYQT